MKVKKLFALALSAVMVLGLAACGDSAANTSTTDTGAATADAGTVTDKTQALSVCLASEPATLDPALNSSVDGATLCLHLFSGLAKWEEDASGNLVIVPDCATELPEGVPNADGTVTYTYTLKDGLKWSDGQDVKAGDFVFAWNLAAGTDLAADYGYMFELVKGYDEIWQSKETGEKDADGNDVNHNGTATFTVNQGTISPRQLRVTGATDASKTYDGTTSTDNASLPDGVTQAYTFTNLGSRLAFSGTIGEASVVKLRFATSSGSAVTVRMHLDGQVTSRCALCLEPVTQEISCDADALFRPGAQEGDDDYPLEGNQVELMPYAREALLLELPMWNSVA